MATAAAKKSELDFWLAFIYNNRRVFQNYNVNWWSGIGGDGFRVLHTTLYQHTFIWVPRFVTCQYRGMYTYILKVILSIGMCTAGARYARISYNTCDPNRYIIKILSEEG